MFNNPACRPLVNGNAGKKLNSSQDVEGTEFLMTWRQKRTIEATAKHLVEPV
jgi:hypothetical protein